MLLNRTIIDFEIIWKKINHTLTEEEEIRLCKWLNEDQKHQQYFEKVSQYYLNGSGFSGGKAETDKAWQGLKNKNFARQKNSRKWVIALAAAVIAILVTITFFLPSEIQYTKPVARLNIKIIKPGSNQAKLILDNGSVYDLNTSKNLLLSEGGSEIKSEGAKLQYTEKTANNQEVKYNTLSIPRGGEFFLQLSDGSKVWLNSETTIRYPVQFYGKERKVELTGEAFFEVAKNEKVPFLVESGMQVIKVLGTEFNISSYIENPLIYTTLVKGSVEVYLKNNPEMIQKLSPNEQSLINSSEMSISKREVNPYQFVAWKDGRFVFVDQSLGDIMKTLSKWYNVDVVFAREDLRNIRFTGNLQRYSDFGNVLRKIGKTNEVEFTVENDRIILK